MSKPNQTLAPLLWANGQPLQGLNGGVESERAQLAQTAFSWAPASTGNNGPAIQTFGFSCVMFQNVSTLFATGAFLGAQTSNDGVNWSFAAVFVDHSGNALTGGNLGPQSAGYAFVGGAKYVRLTGNGDATNLVQWLAQPGGDGIPVVPTDTNGGQPLVTLRAPNSTSVIASYATSSSDANTLSASNRMLNVAAELYAVGGNGAQADRLRCNLSQSALASASRTATTSSADIVNYNWQKIRAVLNVTVASGTGGLQLQVQGKDSISANYYNLNAAPAAVLTTGVFVYDFYPGAGAAAGGITQSNAVLVPRTFRVTVTAGDATSYTYSVSIDGVV